MWISDVTNSLIFWFPAWLSLIFNNFLFIVQFEIGTKQFGYRNTSILFMD